MKIQIDYALNTIAPETPIGAQTEYRGEKVYALGRDKDEAKERLLAKVRVLMLTVPKREIVELEEPEPEEELPGIVIIENDLQKPGYVDFEGNNITDQENLSF